jgi:hypothetical protein
MTPERWGTLQRLKSMIMPVLLLALVSAVMVSSTNVAMASSGTYFLEQDGNVWIVTPEVTIEDVATFYDYGPPASTSLTDQPLEDTSVVFLHEDSLGVLSLVVINDTIGDPDGGRAQIDLSGLDPDAEWLAKDDPGEVYVDADALGDATARWAWAPCCTDGGAIGDLGDDVDISASFDPTWTNVPNLAFWDADSDSHIELDISKPFTINQINTKAEILDASGVPDQGIDKAPGLDKEFNPKGKGAENAGKKN